MPPTRSRPGATKRTARVRIPRREKSARGDQTSVGEAELGSTALLALERRTSLRQRTKAQWEALLAPIRHFPDDDLWRLAKRHLTEAEAERLDNLVYQQQSQGLTREEIGELEAMLAAQNRMMLFRAEAMALLRERGHDISPLFSEEA